jgi:hypothetical protein
MENRMVLVVPGVADRMKGGQELGVVIRIENTRDPCNVVSTPYLDCGSGYTNQLKW